MDWAVDGTDLAQEPILESAQENQDSDFIDELHVSETPHPLFNTVPLFLGPIVLQAYE